MSFLGLYIEEMFASIGASSQDNFIQDFARRLGGGGEGKVLWKAGAVRPETVDTTGFFVRGVKVGLRQPRPGSGTDIIPGKVELMDSPVSQKEV